LIVSALSASRKLAITGFEEVGWIGNDKSAYVDRFKNTLLIPYQSVFALTDRTWALQNCMSVIPKEKKDSESGLFTSGN